MRALALVLFSSLITPAGPSSAAEPLREPHPEPRVIVNVTEVQGPHARRDVERAARQGWGRIVRCYESIDRSAKGVLELRLKVAARGEISAVTLTRSTLPKAEIGQCVARALKGLAMPTASAASTAHTEIHLAPGDP